MRRQPLYLALALSLTVCGCSDGGGTAAHPKIGTGQIEKDALAGLPNAGSDGAYNEGEIEILESNYSGNKATIVVSAGSLNVGSLVPREIEDLKPEIQPKVASIDTIPYKVRLHYEWVRGEWRLRSSSPSLTFENWPPNK